MDTSLVPMPAAPLTVTLNAPLSPIVEFSYDNASGQYFKKVPACFYDLSNGELGVLRASRDSYAVFVPAEDRVAGKGHIKIRPVAAMGLPVSAYAVRTPIGQLNPGDLVSVTGSDTWLYYQSQTKEGGQGEVKNPSISGIRVEDGVKIEITLSESLNFPGYNVLCVKNLVNEKATAIKKMFPQLALLSAGGRGEEGRDRLSKLLLCMLAGGKGADQADEGQGEGAAKGSQGLDMKSLLLLMTLDDGGNNALMTTMLLQNGDLLK